MKYLLIKYLRRIFIYINIREQLLIFKYRKEKKILQIHDLCNIFKGSSFFAFATGGSVANLDRLNLLHDKNVFIFSRGIVNFYRLYGVMPNIWFVHNPDSIKMTIREIKKYNMEEKIDFSETFIMVPSNSSDSKECSFSSKEFMKFRSLIQDKAIFVLYNEEFKPYMPDKVPDTYLDSVEPIKFINGSAVENTFLPWLGYIGVKDIFFSGVDHMDTGHFWDRKEYYQDINGNPLNFQEIHSNELIYECGRVAREKCKEKGINVYRLEKEETILKDYEFMDFDKACSLASRKITPHDLRL